MFLHFGSVMIAEMSSIQALNKHKRAKVPNQVFYLEQSGILVTECRPHIHKPNEEGKKPLLLKMRTYKTMGNLHVKTMLACDWHTNTGRPAFYLAMGRK